MSRWLTKQEYNRIRYKANKLGANDICLRYIDHQVTFGDTTVFFAFRPFQCETKVSTPIFPRGRGVVDRASAQKVKEDIDRAVEFMEFLAEFNKSVENDKGEVPSV